MRQPIQRQLLWPMLAVVVLGSATTALIGAWFGTQTARQAEQERLRQLVSTLVDPGFPLTNAVLKRMSDLSGAEFVTLSESGGVLQASGEFTEDDRRQLAALPIHPVDGPLTEDRPLTLSTGEVRAVRMPIRTLAASRPASLVILTSQQRWNDLARQAAWPPLIAGLLAASGAALLAVILSQQFVTRIRFLAKRAEILADGDFETHPPPPVDDELRDLAMSLNTTANQLKQYEQQVRAGERLQTLGKLGAGMAHQLRNAITGARMALDLHTGELPEKVDRESLAVAVRQLTLMETYLQRFLTVGRGGPPAMKPVDLAALTADALQLIDPICRHHAIEVAWQPPPEPVTLQGDAESLRQMLLNLLMNAVEAVQPQDASERKIGIEIDSLVDSVVRLRIRDRGPGPAPDIAKSMFVRFITDKPDGTGLGLAVAQEIAHSHGGNITWRRETGWTVFDIVLSQGAVNSQASGDG